MKPLRSLSFASPSFAWLFGHRANRRSRQLAVVGLALTAVCLLTAAGVWLDLRMQRSERQDSLAATEQRASRNARPPTRPASAPAFSAAERVRINRLVRRLNTPWPSIFAALETQALPGVAVLSVEPDVERGALRVHTEGPSLDELLRHAARVQESPQFAGMQLLRIDPEEAKGGSEMSRLSFDLVLTR